MSKTEKYFEVWNKQFEEKGVPFNSFAEHSSAFAEAFLKSIVNAISDDEMLKEKATYRFHKHMVDYEMGLNEGFENGYDWTKNKILKQ